jgi:hypothetical protein
VPAAEAATAAAEALADPEGSLCAAAGEGRAGSHVQSYILKGFFFWRGGIRGVVKSQFSETFTLNID